MHVHHRLRLRSERREGHLLTPLGVAHLTALELPPPVFVREAAIAGFTSVGFRVAPAVPGSVEYPLKIGTQAQQELRRILRGEDVGLYDVEFVPLTPEVDVQSYAGLLEAAADLGAVSLNVSGDDPDLARLAHNFAAMCDLAGSFGLRVDLEFMRWRVCANLHDAVRLVSEAGKSNSAILLDCLHLDRSGGQPADLRDVPASFIRVCATLRRVVALAGDRSGSYRGGARATTAAGRGQPSAGGNGAGAAIRRDVHYRSTHPGDGRAVAFGLELQGRANDAGDRGTVAPS